VKRTIIPKSTTDRVFVLVSLSCAITSTILLLVAGADRVGQLGLGVAAFGLGIAYLLQDQRETANSAAEYTTVISNITGIVTQLADLNAFLERERTRIKENEATVKRLSDEKAKLEPVVLTHRETIEAILSAHSQRTAKNVWKERALGFVFGVASSLAASLVYDYIRR